MMHDKEVEVPAPITNCLSVNCGKRLTGRNISDKVVFCSDCLNDFMVENMNIISTHFNTRDRQLFRNKINYGKRKRAGFYNTGNTIPGSLQNHQSAGAHHKHHAQRA